MEKLVAIMQSIWDFWEWISNAIVSIAWFLTSILWFIWYGWKTLLIWILKLLYFITWTQFGSAVSSTIWKLSTYIWPIGSTFLYAMFFLIIIRLLVWVVFKIIKWDFWYDIRKTNWRKWRKQSWEPTDYVEDETYPRLP